MFDILNKKNDDLTVGDSLVVGVAMTIVTTAVLVGIAATATGVNNIMNRRVLKKKLDDIENREDK